MELVSKPLEHEASGKHEISEIIGIVKINSTETFKIHSKLLVHCNTHANFATAHHLSKHIA